MVYCKMCFSTLVKWLVDEMFVDFIRDAEQVVANDHFAQGFELVAMPDFAQWVVWVVKDDGLGLLAHHLLQHRQIKHPVFTPGNAFRVD